MEKNEMPLFAAKKETPAHKNAQARLFYTR
jgi:hypothetical protein